MNLFSIYKKGASVGPAIVVAIGPLARLRYSSELGMRLKHTSVTKVSLKNGRALVVARTIIPAGAHGEGIKLGLRWDNCERMAVRLSAFPAKDRTACPADFSAPSCKPFRWLFAPLSPR